MLCERRKYDGKEDHKNRTCQKTGAAERTHDEASLCILSCQYSIRGTETFSGNTDTILHKADTGKRTLDMGRDLCGRSLKRYKIDPSGAVPAKLRVFLHEK